MCKRSKTRFLLARVIFIVCILSALMPLSCFDQDGYLDSFVTESLLLIPTLHIVTSLFCVWIRFPTNCIITRQSFFTLIVPPPIPTE